jgi:hypothetical protein
VKKSAKAISLQKGREGRQRHQKGLEGSHGPGKGHYRTHEEHGPHGGHGPLGGHVAMGHNLQKRFLKEDSYFHESIFGIEKFLIGF